MGPFLKFLWFLKTGRTHRQTWREERDQQLGKRGPPIGGFAILFIAFCVLAIIVKLVLAASGNDFDLSASGLVQGYALLWIAAAVVLVIVIFRKLFLWRYGESSSDYGELKPGGGCAVIVLCVVGAMGLLALYIQHSYESSLPARTVPPTVESSSGAESKTPPAEVADSAERQALVARLNELHAGLWARWREDVAYAGASGEFGVTPPMLEVSAQGRNVWNVKNLARSPACVQLVRVSKLPGG